MVWTKQLLGAGRDMVFWGAPRCVGLELGCQRGCITMTSVPGYKAWCHGAHGAIGGPDDRNRMIGSHQVTLVIPHLQAVAVETKIGIISTTWM